MLFRSKAQLAIIEEFLPELMSSDQIEKFVKQKYDELEVKDITKKGLFMSGLMKELKGRADGNIVRMVVDQLYR